MYQIGRPSTTLSGLASLDLMFGLFLLLSCTVNATVVCEECRSLDLQEGPGTYNGYRACLNDKGLMLTAYQGLACLWPQAMGPHSVMTSIRMPGTNTC